MSDEVTRWTAIFAQDLAKYNAKNNKEESVRILAASPSDANQKCIVECTVCPNKDTRMMRVRGKFAFRAASFISGHLAANTHKLNYNQRYSMHKYVIEKTVTTKCETNTVEGIQGKIAKAMMCSDTSKRFSIELISLCRFGSNRKVDS